MQFSNVLDAVCRFFPSEVTRNESLMIAPNNQNPVFNSEANLEKYSMLGYW